MTQRNNNGMNRGDNHDWDRDDRRSGNDRDDCNGMFGRDDRGGMDRDRYGSDRDGG